MFLLKRCITIALIFSPNNNLKNKSITTGPSAWLYAMMFSPQICQAFYTDKNDYFEYICVPVFVHAFVGKRACERLVSDSIRKMRRKLLNNNRRQIINF